METLPIWQAGEVKHAMQEFTDFVQDKYQLKFSDYASLHHFSVQEKSLFWQAIAEFFSVSFSQPPQAIYEPGAEFIQAKWFRGAQLNYAQHVLRHRGSAPAIISYSEQGYQTSLSFDELYTEVAALRSFLMESGIVAGDRVVGILSNTHHAVVAMLACSAIGAIWASCSPDFGAEAIIERFIQIKPKCLIAVSSHRYQGKEFCHDSKLSTVLAALDTVTTQLSIEKSSWANFTWKDVQEKCAHASLEFASLDFNHPLCILFSSGTTGKPKCILHRSGGVLLQHLKELGLHTNLTKQDRLLFFTTCAWMMWNWMVSALALGSSIVLYDGSPMHPYAGHLLEVLAQSRTNVFGASPAYFTGLQKQDQPLDVDLSHVRTVLSTGAPLLDHHYDYIQTLFGSKIQISSISGGSDIISCFALGHPGLPVYKGALQCVGLGMDVAVFDEQGQLLSDAQGELVCRSPFPSMPLCFWADEGDVLYRKAYFSRFNNIWTHGDLAQMSQHGGLIIFGRSDDTLNPQGVRIGTAELYQAVQKTDYVKDCVAVSYHVDADAKIVLFVQLKTDVVWSQAISQDICRQIKEQLSPRHLPYKILTVRDIPRTMNGKKMESVVRKLVNKQTIDNISVIVNPECLVDYQNRLE